MHCLFIAREPERGLGIVDSEYDEDRVPYWSVEALTSVGSACLSVFYDSETGSGRFIAEMGVQELRLMARSLLGAARRLEEM